MNIKPCPYLYLHKDVFFSEMMPIDYLDAVKSVEIDDGAFWQIECIVCKCRGPSVFAENETNGEALAWKAWNMRM